MIRAFAPADLPQGSPRWHALRARRYGASDIGALAEVSHYRTPGQVWSAKVAPSGERRAPELQHRVGHVLEGLALDLWREETGQDGEPGPVLVEEAGWLLASLDHWSADREPIDAKVRFRGGPEWALWSEGTIPEDVALQITQQALLVEALTGRRLETAHVAAILISGFGLEFRAYRLALTAERREMYGDIAAAVPLWHAAYVATRTPPPTCVVRDIAATVEVSAVRRRDATNDEAALLGLWRAREAECAAARRQLATAESARDAVRDPLCVSVGPDASIPGVRWAPFKGQKPRFQLEK